MFRVFSRAKLRGMCLSGSWVDCGVRSGIQRIEKALAGPTNFVMSRQRARGLSM